MAFSGMDIFKLLPKTNCGACGSPSCLAFAMKVAGGKGHYSACPQLSEDSRRTLDEMTAPPIVEIVLNRGKVRHRIGGEKVLYRHEEAFYSPPPLLIQIRDGLSWDDLEKNILVVESLKFHRGGQNLTPDGVAIEDGGGNPNFVTYFRKIYERVSCPVAVRTSRRDIAEEIIAFPSLEGVILSLPMDLAAELARRVERDDLIIAVESEDLASSLKAGALLRELGISRGLISLSCCDFATAFETLYGIRRGALLGGERNFSYPVIFWSEAGESEICRTAAALLKYAGVLVVNSSDPDEILTLLTLRQNIFADPRSPVQVEAKLYPIGNVNESSPVVVTTNFSLTYFLVSQEIESSGVPTYLLIIDTDGASVLSAWAAGRFNSSSILEGLEKSGIKNLVNHKNVIIPGYVAPMKEDIEEDSTFNVIVGPAEASDLPAFLRANL